MTIAEYRSNFEFHKRTTNFTSSQASYRCLLWTVRRPLTSLKQDCTLQISWSMCHPDVFTPSIRQPLWRHRILIAGVSGVCTRFMSCCCSSHCRDEPEPQRCRIIPCVISIHFHYIHISHHANLVAITGLLNWLPLILLQSMQPTSPLCNGGFFC